MKPRKGLSFFMKTTQGKEQYAFCIVLSAKSDEDGEYKVLRTPFTDTKVKSISLPLDQMTFYHFEEGIDDGIEILEWDTDAVRSVSRKNLYPVGFEVQEMKPEVVSGDPEMSDDDLSYDDLREAI